MLVPILSTVVILAGLLILFFIKIYQPWQLNWGAKQEEIERTMLGDDIVPTPSFNATRAITINARPDQIWPWLVQIGYQKGGFYSYDWLDNGRIPSADHIIPEYQHIKVGDIIELGKTTRSKVETIRSNEGLLLVTPQKNGYWTWAWGLYQVDEHTTRLVTRLRVDLTKFISQLYINTFEIIMMRKHLLGIKQRAESIAQ